MDLRRLRADAMAIAFGIVLLVGVLIGALAWARSDRSFPPRAPAARPALLLLTTLPLVFPEDFSLRAINSSAYSAMEQRYRITLIDSTQASELRKARMLVLAHPRAQTAEALVDLDRWVRNGGRLLLLADPKLDWPSQRALGDTLRPPLSFADTGLLAHWGLRLETPVQDGLVMRELEGFDVRTSSPGLLSGRACDIGGDGFVAHCSIGKGKVTVVADADFLRLYDGDGYGRDNLTGLLAELADLEP